MQLQFRTDLNCGSCISKVKPFLDGEPSVQRWEVDTKDPRKVLTVHGANLDAVAVSRAVASAGFHVLGELATTSPAPATAPASAAVSAETYRPLILIFCYLLGTVVLAQYGSAAPSVESAMAQFMGGFFLVFSFFKFLNLGKFADAYATYDVLAKRWRAYGLAYPFIELSLGVAYLAGTHRVATNAATALVMGVSTIGVVQALRHKRAIECACLGTVFNLPMTKVTLFEDLLMLGMALAMLGL